MSRDQQHIKRIVSVIRKMIFITLSMSMVSISHTDSITKKTFRFVKTTSMAFVVLVVCSCFLNRANLKQCFRRLARRVPHQKRRELGRLLMGSSPACPQEYGAPPKKPFSLQRIQLQMQRIFDWLNAHTS